MYSRAFSLVELLAVILIVAILLGLMAPALRGSRDAARAATCGSNLRSLAQGTQAIATFERPLPVAHEAVTLTEAEMWDLGPGVWLCPSVEDWHRPFDAPDSATSYSYVPGVFLAESGWLEHPQASNRGWVNDLYQRYPNLPLFEDWGWPHAGRRQSVDINGAVRSKNGGAGQ